MVKLRELKKYLYFYRLAINERRINQTPLKIYEKLPIRVYHDKQTPDKLKFICSSHWPLQLEIIRLTYDHLSLSGNVI